MAESGRGDLCRRVDAIEGAYEFFLAYAAQGLRQEGEGSRVSGQFRAHIDAMAEAVHGITTALDRLIEEESPQAATALRAFGEVLAADALRAGAAIEAVRAQPFASSQLVDNLNASIHIRALLTDLFLLDELLGLEVDLSPAAKAADPA